MGTGINHCRSSLVFSSLVSSHPVINWHTHAYAVSVLPTLTITCRRIHTLHTHTHLSVILTHPHAGCLHSYCCSPHPVPAIATETSLTALLFLQIHPHFNSPWKNIFLYLFFSPHPQQKLPVFTIHLSWFPLGVRDTTARRQFISFLLPQKHKCKISRGL